MKQKQKNFSLKDQLFSDQNIKHLSDVLHTAYPQLNKALFTKEIIAKRAELELKEVISHIAISIQKHIPLPYQKLINTLKQSLNPGDYGSNFIFAAYSEIVATEGCNTKDLAFSLEALGEFTKYFSAEFAIRDFLNTFPQETLKQCNKWSKSNNTDQRRLASEGTRPKLPWAKAITTDHTQAITILTRLHSDPERYVTRSVANHMNDISKIDPALCVETLKGWQKKKEQEGKELEHIVKHSLRTLIKKGDAKALALLGYNKQAKIQNITLTADKEIKIGESLTIKLSFKNQAKQKLLIDFKVKYPDNSQKVFKWKSIECKKDEEIALEKRHPFRIMTTKALAEGEYEIEIQINGKKEAQEKFVLHHQ